MFRAHSLLWDYLWVAPNLLLLVLGFLIWKRGIAMKARAFFAFTILSAISELAVYAADVLPTVGPRAFWGIDWASLLIEGVLKFLLIGEIFSQVFGSYRSVARLGRILIHGVGIALILVAAVAAAYASENSHFEIVSSFHLLEQAVYLIESGLLVFITLFSFYFQLAWGRRAFGITLGLGISSCVQLASWALIDNGGLPDSKRTILVFLNMATYHVCVLIWFYYLLVPSKVTANPAVPLPENNLDVWNRELERLVRP